MTVLTDTQVVNASGGLVELGYSQRTTALTVSGAVGSQTDTGLSVTAVCDGSPILVEFFCPSSNIGAAAGDQVVVDLWYDGTDYGYMCGNYTASANTGQSVPMYGSRRMTPTAGSHTFAAKAWKGTNNATLNAGNGTSVDWGPTYLRVSKIVQATQWPAVTTGTIICTSSTRPASPFAGQVVYETDTGMYQSYNGSAWIQNGGISSAGWTSFTPTISQGVSTNISKSINYAKYTRFGNTVHYQFRIGITGAGTAGSAVNVSLPVNAAYTAGGLVVGSAWYYQVGGTRYGGSAELTSASTIGVSGSFSAGNLYGAVPSAATANGDYISAAITYEV